MSLSTLPDATPVYVDGYGQTTLGECRTEETPALDEREATLQMYEDLATRNLCRPPCQPAVSHSDIVAYHASRYMSARAARAST